MPQAYTVTVGFGDQGSDAMDFAPKWLDIYAGDTVTWRDDDALDPHTVSFGPLDLLEALNENNIMPLPQKQGPPIVALNPRVANATPGHTYDGTGYANSGLLHKGRTWSLTFTTPGTFHYICLIHGQIMGGDIVVHPRPAAGKLFVVQVGDSNASARNPTNNTQNMQFFPRQLTIHVGDTVAWSGSSFAFHTISFGPVALRDQLEQHLVVPVPQKSGLPLLTINPKIALPSGGSTYNGTGFVNSGILAMQGSQNSNQPPTYRLTFTKPGTYEYDCLIHPHMEGVITVLPAEAA
jgi:plastocyanin